MGRVLSLGKIKWYGECTFDDWTGDPSYLPYEVPIEEYTSNKLLNPNPPMVILYFFQYC